MATDSLAQTLARLANAAAAKGKTINTTPLTDAEREAYLMDCQARSQDLARQIQATGQVGCPAAPKPQPQTPAIPAVPDGKVWLDNTWEHRKTIKASGQAGYDSQARRWYLIDQTQYDKIPVQCLPPGYQQPPAGAGGRAAQTAKTADQAPAKPVAAVKPEQEQVVESPASTTDTPKRATVIPFWPPGVRGLPNPVIRSSLFGVVRRGRRELLQQVRLPSIGGTEILYTGARLDQADLDAWMGIMELFKGQDIAQRLGRVTVPIREFLRIIGREAGGSGMRWIMRVMSRLSATDLQIKDGDYTYGGSLVVRYARDERTGQLMIEADPKLVALFQTTKWSHIDWQERQALGQDHLAKWLHAFYSSHAEAYPIKVRTLQEWSGASMETPYHFRAELRSSMARIAQATGWTWEIDRNDCLHVKKPRALPEPE